MSYSTLQKDLERITLKKDLEQALDRMVDFEEEVNRNEEEEGEGIGDFVLTIGSYLVGVAVGFSLAKTCLYINGRGKDNQR